MNLPKRNYPYDTFDLNPHPSTPDPLDVDLGDGSGNRRVAARARDFDEIERQLRSEKPDEASTMFKLRQLGDRGLRAAMKVLKKDTSK